MAEKVELHDAFFWACDDCGADNFARAVTLDEDSEQIPEALRMLGQAERAVMQSVVGDGDEIEAGTVWMTKPDRVTCKDCGVTYEVAPDL